MSQFTRVPVQTIPTNSFDLSHNVKLTCDAGYIIPIKCVEALPADTFSYNNKVFCRLAPMVAPVMEKMDVTMITGFVSMRLLWANSEKFFAEPVPSVTTPVAPYFDNVQAAIGSLEDYMGIPTKTFTDDAGNTVTQYTQLDGVSALPLAAYQKFYSDWFRDENLVNLGQDTFIPLTDGSNVLSNYNQLRRRAWRHDYFTSNLPFAQKGAAVEIPIANFQDVEVFRRVGASDPSIGTTSTWATTLGTGPSPTSARNYPSDNPGTPIGNLVADTSALSQSAAVTINTLRWAEKLQVFLEKNARGGTRYTEIVRQHFGQRSSDARLQRSEFIGFSVNPVIISEVLQTSETTPTNTPLGEMAGHGISYGGSKKITYHAEEHGFFITFLSVRPKTSYMQGLARMFSRKTPLDYAWPTFAQLGEQETLNKEIYATGTASDDGTFGYLPRYAEMRYESDRVCGEMRTSYNHWHMTRIFTSLPLLNEAFINCVPTKRIFAVNLAGVHSYIINVNHELYVRRALPKFGIPAL